MAGIHGDHPVAELPAPDGSRAPAAVIAVQLQALAANDDPFTDAGIKTAYNFASPSNRRATGPLEQFVRMVSTAPYAAMVDHVSAQRGILRTSAETAEQRVELTGPDGQQRSYVFGLSRQNDGSLEGCWLTDRVLVE